MPDAKRFFEKSVEWWGFEREIQRLLKLFLATNILQGRFRMVECVLSCSLSSSSMYARDTAENNMGCTESLRNQGRNMIEHIEK